MFRCQCCVDQDLSAIVAETINDDDVKWRLVPIVFHARVTTANVAQARRYDSRAPMYMNTHPCKQGFKKKDVARIDAENMDNSGEEIKDTRKHGRHKEQKQL